MGAADMKQATTGIIRRLLTKLKDEKIKAIESKKIDAALAKLKSMKFKKGTPIHKVTKMMLKTDPKNRKDATTILMHEFFTKASSELEKVMKGGVPEEEDEAEFR